jgi:hypothetical protein
MLSIKFICKSFSKSKARKYGIKNMKLKNVSDSSPFKAAHLNPISNDSSSTISGNAVDLESSYYTRANEENLGYSKNIKRIYDTGHDKYKYRKSVQEPENKNITET